MANYRIAAVRYIMVLCVASAPRVIAAPVPAETFVILSGPGGREATLQIPVDAVTQLSANFCESLVGYGDPQFESMRLRGDVSIRVAGREQPIQIKADTLVVELTPDFAVGSLKSSRADAATHRLKRSAGLPGGDAQILSGDVVLDLQTAAGRMEIKADKVEHRQEPKAGA